MNAEEFAAFKKETDAQMAAFDVESQKLCDALAAAQQGLAELSERRTAVKNALRAATLAFQATRLGLAQPNVVSVPAASIKVKGN